MSLFIYKNVQIIFRRRKLLVVSIAKYFRKFDPQIFMYIDHFSQNHYFLYRLHHLFSNFVSNRLLLKIKIDHFLRSRCVNFNWHIFTIMNRYMYMYVFSHRKFLYKNIIEIIRSNQTSSDQIIIRFELLAHRDEPTFETTFASLHLREKRQKKKKKQGEREREREEKKK